MDINNCLDLSSDLEHLEQDMQAWMQLPYELRKRANDQCLLKYGCTNYQLYNTLKAKLLSSENLNDDDMKIYVSESVVTEGFVKSSDDIEYNVDKFMRKSVKVLFIGGLPGSGKSTMADYYQRETNALLVNLDIIDNMYSYTDDDMEKMNYIIQGFYKTSIGKKYRQLHTTNALKNGSRIDQFVHLYRNFIEYAAQNLKKEDQLILEGVHIQLVCSLGELNVKLIQDNAAILIGASVLKSASRAFRRNFKKLKKEKGKVDVEVITQAFSGLFSMFYTIENNEKRLQIAKKIIMDEVMEEAAFRFEEDPNQEITAAYLGDGEGMTKDGRINDRLEKIQASRDAQSVDNVVIISDFIDDDNPNYTPGELEQQYRAYTALTSERKVRSDGLSSQIWGRSVTDMYLYMKEKFQKIYDDKEVIDEDPSDTLQLDYTDQELRNYKDTIEMESGNYLQSMIRKIDCLLPKENISIYESAVLEGFGKKINGAKYSYRQDIPEVLPFVTYDEYVNNPESLDMKKIHGQVDPFTYVMNWRDLKEAYSALRSAYRTGDKEKLIEMGWNPYVEPTPENMKYARDRQIKWFDENYGIDIYDISGYTSTISQEMINESDIENRLEPIFILANAEKEQYTLPKVIPFDHISRIKFFNIGFSEDTSMRKIYSFNDNTYSNGLVTSDLSAYCKMGWDRYNDTRSVVIAAFFVEPRLKEEIFNGINFYMSNQGNQVARNELIYRNALANYQSYSMYVMTAQMIQFLLNVSNVYYKNMDRAVFKQRYNVFTIYKGEHNRYKVKDANILIGKLRNNYTHKKLNYVKESDVYSSISSKTLDGFNIYTNNNKVNDALMEINTALTPVVIKSVGFEDADTLEKRLNDAVTLLSQYDVSDVEGMKRQLMEIRYVNIISNTRLRHLSQNHPMYSKIDLIEKQSRLTMEKYLKVVIAAFPGFDFDGYCKTSGIFKLVSFGDDKLFKYDGTNVVKYSKKQDEEYHLAFDQTEK